MSNLPVKAEESPRQAESESYQQSARGRITALPFSVGLIILGILLMTEDQIEGFSVDWLVAGLIMIAALVLTFLFRFFTSGRRERGLFFLAMSLISFGGTFALINIAPNTFDIVRWYPLFIVGIGLALLLTYFAERDRERGLIGVGLLVLAMGGVSFTVSLDIIPQDLIDTVGDYYPLIIAFIGVTLIPLALRRSAE